MLEPSRSWIMSGSVGMVIHQRLRKLKLQGVKSGDRGLR